MKALTIRSASVVRPFALFAHHKPRAYVSGLCGAFCVLLGVSNSAVAQSSGYTATETNSPQLVSVVPTDSAMPYIVGENGAPGPLRLGFMSLSYGSDGRGYGAVPRLTYAPGGPTSRPTIASGATRSVPGYRGEEVEAQVDVPIPDLFRMEAPFVERNLRLDYLATNRLQEPRANESQFRAELTYSFTDRLGVAFGVPFRFLDRFEDTDTAGFGDIEAGVRYVLIGPKEDAVFKLAAGLNVSAPTGDSGRDLGEGRTSLEPQLLAFQKLGERTFTQQQLSLEVPLGRAETAKTLGFDVGMGHVFAELNNWAVFSYPTPTIEINGTTVLNGDESGKTVVALTPGLRWQVFDRGWGGVALSFPVTRAREFDTQFIFSFVYVFKTDNDVAAAPAPTSRPFVR